MENFLGKDGFVWFIGVIENRADPLGMGRCKIRIFGWHTSNKINLPTQDLPWAQPMYPLNNSKAFSAPQLGEWIVGFFTDGMSGQSPIMMGVLPGLENNESPALPVGFIDGKAYYGPFHQHQGKKMTGAFHVSTFHQFIYDTADESLANIGAGSGSTSSVVTPSAESVVTPSVVTPSASSVVTPSAPSVVTPSGGSGSSGGGYY